MSARPAVADRPVEARSLRGTFVALSVALFAASVWAVWDEAVTRRPWKVVQAEARAVAAARGRRAPEPGIREIRVPALDVADRCTTCHLGVDEPGLEGDDVPRALRTHPRRAELLGAHPVASFGCTPCHGGQGRQTKGVGRAAFAHGADDPSWERPLATRPFLEARCAACHAEEDAIAGAPTLARGRELFVELRCFGCHATRAVGQPFAAAPSLARLRGKASAATVARWLADPRAVRPDARMPSFWPPPVGPDGAPRPEGGPEARAAAEARNGEIAAIVDYLAASTDAALPDPGAIDLSAERAAEGRAIFDRAGCRACHALGDEGGDRPREARFGPALDGVGERVTARWIAAWLAGPRAVWAGARMPDPRLSAEDRARVVAFLVSLRAPGAPAATDAWPAPAPERVEAGRRAIVRYGCAGCHEIPGIPVGPRPGPDLDAFGDATRDRIHVGDAALRCDGPLLECFAREKIRHPRRMASAHVTPVMPESPMSDDDALALAVFVTSNRGGPVAPRRIDDRARALRDGERVIARRNCRGCHAIGPGPGPGGKAPAPPAGGHVRRFYEDASAAPPSLVGVGSKLAPAWLYAFVRAPSTIRPWLAARMPDYGLGADEATALAAYFAALDGRPYPFDDAAIASPPEAREAAEALFEKLECRKCHARGAGGAASERAPDLALAPARLKPAWIARWLRDPEAIAPGTKMPAYFPLSDDDDPTSRTTPRPDLLGGDAERQVDALAALVARGEATNVTTSERGRKKE